MSSPLTQAVGFFLLLSALNCRAADRTRLSAETTTWGFVRITYKIPKRGKLRTLTLYRSYVDLRKMSSLNIYENPITRIELNASRFSGEVLDSIRADGVTYHYYLSAIAAGSREPYQCNFVSITTGPQGLLVTDPEDCFLIVDKTHYVLELWAEGNRLKSYPVNLGRDPFTRKLFRDRMTTPEGMYRVAYVNLNSRFYKALMLNYPTETDKQRYRKALRENRIPLDDRGTPESIGGDIAIHGGGIGNNWTWGCVAMEDHAIDELLAMDCIKPGTRVFISGPEVTRKAIDPSLINP